MSDDRLIDLPVDGFLASMASDEAAPGGGAAAAVAVAMSAALVAMAARLSTRKLDDADALAAEADELRRQTAPLADADAAAYGAVLEAFRLPRDDDGARRERIRTALSDAADVPLRIAEAGEQVGRLAEHLAAAGNPNLAGDAITAGQLAAAGARSAATLARLNLDSARIDDDRLTRARALQHIQAEEIG